MLQKKLISIGSLTFDIFVKPKKHEIVRVASEDQTREYLQFPFGEKIRVSDVHECFGGGGANTAISFVRLGLSASVYGAVGDDDWSKLIIGNLQNEKVKTSYIEKVREKTGFSVIINSFEGERTVLAFAGANHAMQKIDITALRNADGVHLCHLSGKSSQIFEIIRNFYKKNPEKFLSWNPGKEQIEKGLDYFKDFFPVVDVLTLNKEEAEEFAALKVVNNNYKKLFRSFIKIGFSGVLVITDGRRGAYACDGKKIIHCDILKSSPRVDTLGAGDAFASAFAATYLQKKDLILCLKSGTINAASVVSEYGAQKGLLHAKTLGQHIKEFKLSIQETKL